MRLGWGWLVVVWAMCWFYTRRPRRREQAAATGPLRLDKKPPACGEELRERGRFVLVEPINNAIERNVTLLLAIETLPSHTGVSTPELRCGRFQSDARGWSSPQHRPISPASRARRSTPASSSASLTVATAESHAGRAASSAITCADGLSRFDFSCGVRTNHRNTRIFPYGAVLLRSPRKSVHAPAIRAL